MSRSRDGTRQTRSSARRPGGTVGQNLFFKLCFFFFHLVAGSGTAATTWMRRALCGFLKTCPITGTPQSSDEPLTPSSPCIEAFEHRQRLAEHFCLVMHAAGLCICLRPISSPASLSMIQRRSSQHTESSRKPGPQPCPFST